MDLRIDICFAIYTLYVVDNDSDSFWNSSFYHWLIQAFLWVTAMHVVLNLFSAGIRHMQKISAIYYITCAIKYCVVTLIMMLFYYMGWNVILGGAISLFMVVVLSYIFGRSGILGKV